MSETLDVTVKTMDSQSRLFTVPVNITIKEFKEKISSSVNVPANQQRLIFYGRVLADDVKLTRDHHQKSLHLVQRLPTVTTTNQTTSTRNTRSTSATNNTGTTTNTTAPAGQNVFNPAQLSQMIFDQLFFGQGGMMQGGVPGVPGGTVPVPGAPGGQMAANGMNFVIEMGANQGNPHQRPPTMGASNQPRPARQTFSAPRRMLTVARQYIDQLEVVLARLESDNTESDVTTTATTPAPEVNAFAPPSEENILESLEDINETGEGEAQTEVQQGESNEQNNEQTPTTSTSSTSTNTTRTCNNHPSLGELGQVYEQMVSAQTRLSPYVANMITFFNTDPPFTSTQSPEFQYTTRWLGNTLRAQQIFSELQRVLSHVVIPIGRTPPRTVLVQTPRPNMANHRPGNQMTPPQPHFTPIQVNPPQGQHRPRTPLPQGARMMRWTPSGPQGMPPRPQVPGARPRMISVASTVPQMIQGSVNGTPFRLRTVTHTVDAGQFQIRNNQQRGNVTPISNIASAATANVNTTQQANPQVNTTSSNTPTQATTTPTPLTPQPTPVNVTPNTVNTGPGQPEGNQARSGTQFTIAPPTYNVQINATIEPRVQIQVNPLNSGSNQEPQPTPAPINVNINPTTASGSQQGVINQPNAGVNVNGNIPNVPGIPQEVMSSIFQNVAQTLQQNGNGNPTVGADVMIVQGPDQNVIPNEISNMLSQSVWNVSNGVLSGEYNTPQTSASPQTTASDTVPQTSANPQTTTTSIPQTTATPSQKKKNWLLVAVLGEILERLGLPRFPAKVVDNLHWDVSVFDPLMGPLMIRVKELFFGRNSPSREDIHSLSEILSGSMSGYVTEIFSDASVRPDTDIVASNQSLVSHSLRRTFEILFLTSESEFPRQFHKHFNQTLGLFIHLNKYLLQSGLEDLTQLFRNYSQKDNEVGKFLKKLFNETENVTTDLTALAVTYPARQSQIDQFVVTSTPAMPIVDPESSVAMETNPVVPNENKQPQEGNKEKGQKAEDPDAWKNEVPADWVEVISHDVEKQRVIPPQPPFSEAYMAGMPASKKRKV